MPSDTPSISVVIPTWNEAPTISATLQHLTKTGYPRETLELDMDLESDLGIDSIKRVEILSGVQERLPGIPSVEPENLGRLRTLRAVIDYMSTATGLAALHATALPLDGAYAAARTAFWAGRLDALRPLVERGIARGDRET